MARGAGGLLSCSGGLGLMGRLGRGLRCWARLLAFGSVAGSSFCACSSGLQRSLPGIVVGLALMATAYYGPLCTVCRLCRAPLGWCAGCLASLLPRNRWARSPGRLASELDSALRTAPFLPTCGWAEAGRGRSWTALAELEHRAGNVLCLPALSWVCWGRHVGGLSK